MHYSFIIFVSSVVTSWTCPGCAGFMHTFRSYPAGPASGCISPASPLQTRIPPAVTCALSLCWPQHLPPTLSVLPAGIMPATGGSSIHTAAKPGSLQGYTTKTAPPLTSPASADAYSLASGPAVVSQDSSGSKLPASAGTPSAAANGSSSSGNSGSYSYEGTSKMVAGSDASYKPPTGTSSTAASDSLPTLAAGAVAGAAAAAGSAVAGAVGGLVRRAPGPPALLMTQHQDRMVMFLASLVTYPFAFLLTQVCRCVVRTSC
jgi:hypothetical protein